MNHVLRHFQKYGLSNRPIYRFAFLTFLYAIVNGMIAFVLPLFLQEKLNSYTLVGIILGSSSIWNIATDIAFGFTRISPSYVRLMNVVMVAVLTIFLTLWKVEHVAVFFLAVILWGVFTEVYAFAKFNFIESLNDEEDAGLNFGILGNFFSLGGAIAPILVGALILLSKDLTMITGIVITLVMFTVFFLYIKLKRLPKAVVVEKRHLHFITELKLWKKIGKQVFPLLMVFLACGMGDGALLSFGPIFTESNENLKTYGGLILSGIYLPTVVFSGFFGHLADKYGNRKFILYGLLISAVSLLLFGVFSHPLVVGLMALVHGIGYTVFSSAIMAEESLYIERHRTCEKEVVGESGAFYNLGYIVGASLAGVIASIVGNFGIAFGVFGLWYLIVFGVYLGWGKKK
jgi:MFS family permease